MAQKNKSNPNWLQDHLNDPYVKMAQRDGYRARAAYKLLQIDEQFKIFQPGQVIVDLGATPGSWSQYARKKLFINQKLRGTIIAIDLIEMVSIKDVHFMQGDFRDEKVYEQWLNLIKTVNHKEKIDVVLSDMAHNLSGVAVADSAQISHLAELVLDFSLNHLQKQGKVVIKLFHGSGYSQIVEQYKQHFVKVQAFKPQASRAQSAEIFLIAQNLK